MTAREQCLVTLAARMNLTPAEAVALPTVIERAAPQANMSEARLVEKALEIPAVADYLAYICRTVTA